MTLLADPPPQFPPVGPPPMTRAQRRAAAPKPSVPPRRLFLARVLALFSALCVWAAAYLGGFGAIQEGRAQRGLYAALREELASGTVPLGGSITPGVPVALLRIPTAGIGDAVVVEGTSAGDLRNGPGHVRSSVLPGQPGTSVIFGHYELFGAPFRRIARLRVGATINVTTSQGAFVYTVEDVRRPGQPEPKSLTSGQGRLTLVTSDASGWRSGWAPNHLIYVDAKLKDTAVPAPSGRPASVPASEKALGTDWTTVTLLQLVLALQLLIAVIFVVTWARWRWGRWQSWIVGVPIVLAALWLASGLAARFLPNVM